MSNIIGLSHLVFTVPFEKKLSSASPLISDNYGSHEYFEMNHANYRSSMLRHQRNEISMLTLYKPAEGNLPGIELLYADAEVSRPTLSYGLLTFGKVNENKDILSYTFPGTNLFIDYYVDEFLNCPVVLDTNLLKAIDHPGCWLVVSDFDQQKDIFSKVKTGKIITETDNLFVMKCKVINKRLSDFYFILMRDNGKGDNYYNDDLGLSTIGWFTRGENLVSKLNLPYNKTEEFNLSLNGTTFNAYFLYTNKSVSHEILKTII